jgi:hypothetical protein
MLKLLFAALMPLALTPADWTVCAPVKAPDLRPIATHNYAASPQYPRTLYFDGMPPESMRGPATLTVTFGSLAVCGDNPQIEACTTPDKVVHMPNPCDFPGQSYARILCHEKAHSRFGWPADHGPGQ